MKISINNVIDNNNGCVNAMNDAAFSWNIDSDEDESSWVHVTIQISNQRMGQRKTTE